mgnify:CR=1 FL=1
MKKKKIEAIPFMELEECRKEKEVLFVGKTACHVIDGEQHIFLEVFRNHKNGRKVPVLRYSMTHKNWGIYDTETGTWSRRKIDSYNRGIGLCWYGTDQREGRGYQERRKANILNSEEDLKRIKEFFGNIKIYDESDWWEYFGRQESSIKNQTWLRKMEKRRNALKERISNTPQLEEKKILEYAEDTIFHRQHMLYYKKKGKRATMCCSKCGGVFEGRFADGISYESQFERYIQEPKEGSVGKCSLCGATGWYKCQGKAKREYEKSGYLFTADKYRENGIVVRYIKVVKQWVLEECCGEKGHPEMHGSYEKLEGIEIARTYFEPGKKIKTDFQKHDPYREKDFWDDCNLYGMNKISIGAAEVHPEVWDVLKDSEFQYCVMQEYKRDIKENIDILRYLGCYRRLPQLEMLVKLGLTALVKEILRGSEYLIRSQEAKRLDYFLGIYKERVPILLEQNGRIGLLRVLQAEKELEQKWSMEQILKLEELGTGKEDIHIVLQIMTLQKMLNNIEKYAGCEYQTGCSRTEERLRHIATTYIDYIKMRINLGYDLSNTVYQKPRDLMTAHRNMVMEQDKEEIDKRIRETEEKYPNIRNNYRKLRNQYFYEDDKLLIRPARSAKEIVEEGRVLHHCVGGDGYLSSHNKGKSIILMLRTKENEGIPYITVEIEDTRIIQWYGMNDKKPDKENMDEWLNSYVNHLNEKKELAAGKIA